MRIAKLIANNGYCSRREAEKLIEQGKVKVNGVVLKTPAVLVGQEDKIHINGRPFVFRSAEETSVILFYKPKGCVCSRSDEKGRKTIYDFLPERFRKFHYVGRLDLNSEGLMLLTNSARIKRFLELPENNIERVYEVKAYGGVADNFVEEVNQGIRFFDKKLQRKVLYQAQVKKLENQKDDGPVYKTNHRRQQYIVEQENDNHVARNTWFQFKLYEGKNREIRNICEYFELKVSRLKRISFHKFRLKGLKPGAYEKLGRGQIDELNNLDKR